MLLPEQVESLLRIYIAKNGKTNANFSKQVNKMSDGDKKQVLDAVKAQGLLERQAAVRRNYEASQRKAEEDSKILRLSKEEVFDDELDNEEVEEEDDHSSSKRIRYTDAEWDNLANIIFQMRQRHPLPPLIRLITRAIQQTFPANRRRKNSDATLRPILERIAQKEKDQQSQLATYHRYKQTIDTQGRLPSQEELVASLTDEELSGYKERLTAEIYQEAATNPPPELLEKIFEILPVSEVVAHYTPDELLGSIDLSIIVGRAAEGLTETWMLKGLQSVLAATPIPKPHATKHPAQSKPPAIPSPTRIRKPRVAILGCLPNQQNIIRERLKDRAELTFVEKSRGDNAIPDGQDVILHWARFARHSAQKYATEKAKDGCILIVHHGGISKIIEKIEDALKNRTPR